jgi:6-phospho-3-hexuloisomerase
MTCPAVGPGDLLVLSCGPGRISMVEALAGVSRRDGARMLYFTAQPENPVPRQNSSHGL